MAVELGNGCYSGRISKGAKYNPCDRDGNTLGFKAKLLIRFPDA